jgi:periplasmic protein TonB
MTTTTADTTSFNTPPPTSLRGLSLAERPRGARPVAVIVSVAFHLGALLLLVANLGHRPPPKAAPVEREPILVRLPRAAAPPAPPKAAVAKAPVKPRPKPRPEIVQPAVVPPPVPEDPPVVEEEPEPAVTGEDSAEEVAAAPAPSGDGRSGGVVGGIGDGPLELKEVARAPALIERVTPDYPRQARNDHIEGLVLLRAVIGRDGRVERDQIRVVRSVPALDDAAKNALCGWRFSPAIDHAGRTVRVVVEIPFEFTLS